MTFPVARRLPGFRFEVQPSLLDEALPRLDIAAFVGFAASGPLHTPVVVEDPSQFAALFGSDVPLAWDTRRGAPVLAHLAPTVRAYFRNGGRRAWIIRVAGSGGAVNLFPVPGLARIDGHGVITPAFARARSVGSWSDALRVTAALASQSVSVAGVSLADKPMTIDLEFDGPAVVTDGDLLRLGFNGGDDILLATVEGWMAPRNFTGTLPRPGVTRFVIRRSAWFRASWNSGGALAMGKARTFVHDATGAVVEGNAVAATAPVDANGHPAWAATKTTPISLTLNQSLGDAPPPGSLLRADFGGESLWLRVEAARAAAAGSPVGDLVQLTGQGLWATAAAPKPNPAPPAAAERLSFELWVSQAGGDPVKLTGLAFSRDHPRFWGALPSDEALYRETDLARAAEEASASAYAALWQLAAQPRFPLAGDGPDDAWFVPIDMAIVPDSELGPEANVADPLTRDGLAAFDASLFLDPRPNTPLRNLIEADISALPTAVDYLRYDAASPPPFTGIYTVLDVEEATILAVPDAVHRTWSHADAAAILPPIDAPQPTPPASGSGFLDCGLQVIPAPKLVATAPDPTGTFTLSWTVPTTVPDIRYSLQEATEPDYADASEVAYQTGLNFTIYGRPPGDYYYRVRVRANGATSPWSKGIGVRVVPPGAWQVDPVEDYSPKILLTVQRASLRMCAARGDLFAVLAMPYHYREDDVISGAAALRSGDGVAIKAGGAGVGPIGAGEARALSFGAVYHPWVIGQGDGTTGTTRWTPPDGFATGILSLRTLTRGAWVAPANQPWTGPVDLTPTIAEARRLGIQDAQVNLVRHEPHGFVTLSADTLSIDSDLRPINVRRLLILLRRLALRLGATYVFEPNDDSFRRLVRRGFESVLEVLFLRGAFAGDTREASFQVGVTMTPQDVEAGRFIVELRIAPSLPLTFLTIRLIQTGDRGLVAEGS